MNKHTPFVNMAKKGVTGAFFGILFGFALGVLIWLLQSGANAIDVSIPGPSTRIMPNLTPPLSQLTGLGMYFGALIGSIFGCIAGLKEKK